MFRKQIDIGYRDFYGKEKGLSKDHALGIVRPTES